MRRRYTKRLLTATGTTHSCSNHPTEHKLAAYRSHLQRIHKLPLTEGKKKKKEGTEQMATKNGYLHNLINQMKRNIQNKQKPPQERNNNKKWVTFMYVNPTIRKIINIFKEHKHIWHSDSPILCHSSPKRNASQITN
jgi:hypothetical protein